eukprot:maker-scaffold452_size166894-snap-gene-0.35 protein:Tk11698 transcript:maker-scaffold452_size166894-snap-gene-0.35-mRNA-1 annotation:"caskin-1 isoform x2"
MRKIKSLGGMHKGHNSRGTNVAKPVVPPTVPGQRDSCARTGMSSFKPWTEDDMMESVAPLPAGTTRRPSTDLRNGTSMRSLPEDQGIDMTLSPGRDSIGHESTASYQTTGSSVSSGCRNSTTSIDSGRESNTLTMSTFAQSSKSMGPSSSAGIRPHVGLSFRSGCHSSSSSLGSTDRGEDAICTLNIQELIANGVPDREILNIWLSDLNFEDYFDLFDSAGYDMPTISRMTPEDLTAIGIKKPNHRKKLKSEISKLNIGDGLPNFIPPTLDEWLERCRLLSYGAQLHSQGYHTVADVLQISVEDLEDVGIYKLGHQKRFLLAVKKVKELRSGKRAMIGTSEGLPAHPHPNRYTSSFGPSFGAPDHSREHLLARGSQGPHYMHTDSGPMSPARGQTREHPMSVHPLYQPEIIQIGPGAAATGNHNVLPLVQVSPIRGHPSQSRDAAHESLYSPARHCAPLSMSQSPFSSSTNEGNVAPSQSYRQYHHNSQSRLADIPILFHPHHPAVSGKSQASSFSQATYSAIRRPSPASYADNHEMMPITWSKPRAMDDVDVMRHKQQAQSHHHARTLLSNQDIGSGGTLPRPKGLVKPVAKIAAHAREKSTISVVDSEFLEPLKLPNKLDGGGDASLLDPIPDFNPLTNSKPERALPDPSREALSSLDSVSPNEPGHLLESRPLSSCQTQPGAASNGSPSNAKMNRSRDQQRSAGDVLNDIGSMLADLTDELDAMLHSEREEEACD